MIKTVSIRDLVARQFFRGELNRYDIFVRYLAIEEYYGKNDFGFRLYSKMQNNRTGTDYYASYAIGRFRALIESYEVNGYDEKSAIPVGSNLAIWDGSHRVALGLYHNLPNISVDIHPEPKFYEYKIDWFLKNGFSLEEVKIIMDKAEEVLSKNPIKFTGFLWGAAVPYAEEIFKDIEFFGEVSDVKKFSFDSRADYNQKIRQIYRFGEMNFDEIDIKTECLSNYPTEFIFFHFKPFKLYDHWGIKSTTGLPLSLAVERVKSVVHEKYKNKIDNCFYHIIMYICDNQYQSDFCNTICSPIESLKNELMKILGKKQQFGRGAFYQSLPVLNFEGQRDTNARIKLYGLNEILSSDKDILDIGSNCGFFDLQIAPQVKQIDGVEYNPELVKMAERTREFLKYDNVSFTCADFKKFSTNKIYDLVFTFAVHFWIGLPPKEFAKKISSLIRTGGKLIFETHDMPFEDAHQDMRYNLFCEEFEKLGFTKIREADFQDFGLKDTDRIIERKYILYQKN